MSLKELERRKPLITNIQRLCVHDGPGIRTTVFFKGCNLHCPWCANPENISFHKELYYLPEKCIEGCKERESGCNLKELCPYGAYRVIGEFYSEEELFNILARDKVYWGTTGGVTFSGGEPLLSLLYYHNMVKKLRKDSVNITVETALCVEQSIVLQALELVDTFYIDVKMLDTVLFSNIIGGELATYISNVKKVIEIKDKSNILFRIPIVKEYYRGAENYHALYDFLKIIDGCSVEIFSVHNLAEHKYNRLCKKYEHYELTDIDELQHIKERIESVSSCCVKINSF